MDYAAPLPVYAPVVGKTHLQMQDAHETRNYLGKRLMPLARYPLRLKTSRSEKTYYYDGFSKFVKKNL